MCSDLSKHFLLGLNSLYTIFNFNKDVFSDSKETEEEFIRFWLIALCAVYVSPFTRVIENPNSLLRYHSSRICKEFEQICMNNRIILHTIKEISI